METMSSTASHESQAPLHLQRQEMLYPVVMTMGKKIRTARKARKMSLEALGDELGVTRQLVWQWERGDSDPSKHIEAIAKALEMPVEHFFGQTRAATALQAKIDQLSPAQRAALEPIIDQMLGIETEISPPRRKTSVK